jgi:flagellar motor switch protein FliN
MSDPTIAATVTPVEITGDEKETLLRFEEGVATAFTDWFRTFSALQVTIKCDRVDVAVAREALLFGEGLPLLCHCPFRLDDEEKDLFCIAPGDMQKYVSILPPERPELQSTDHLVENYRAVLANELAEAQLALPKFLPLRATKDRLTAEDLPADPFLRFEYAVHLLAETIRLTRFVSMRLLSTIKAAPPSMLDAAKARKNPMSEYSEETPLVEKVEFAPLTSKQHTETSTTNVEMLYDLHVDVIAELGRTSLQLRDVLALGRGSIIELPKLAGDPVELYVNDKKIGSGEVVVVDDHFAVRVIHLVNTAERIKNLGE